MDPGDPRCPLETRAVEPRPVRVAPRVLLVPERAPPPQDGVLHLPVRGAEGAERAVFGDGSHPTTRLCAGAVDLLCRQERPAAVLDVGTGTGVLARIARARGAAFVVGTDVDPAALAWAARQCALDAARVDVLLSAAPPDAWGARFDLIVANILEAPLTTLAPQIAAALKPGATVLLSGFTPLQAPALRAVYGAQALRFVQVARLDGWSLLRFTR